jgi:hypothetical protein
MNTSEVTDKPSSVMSTVGGMFGSVMGAVGLGGDKKKDIEYNRDPATGALYNVFMCTIAKGQGFKEGFDWGIDLVNLRESTESKTLECLGGGSNPQPQNMGGYGGYDSTPKPAQHAAPQNQFSNQYGQQQQQYSQQQQYGQQQYSQQQYGQQYQHQGQHYQQFRREF